MECLGLVDSHFHLLEMEKKGLDGESIISSFFQEGGAYLLEIAINHENFERRERLSQAYKNLYLTAGIHPTSGSDFSPSELSDALTSVQEQAKSPRVVAIGEIGLDLFHDKLPLGEQIERFRTQIEIANQSGLPIVIHTREATPEVLKVLRESPCQKGGVIHSFTGDTREAEEFCELGFFLGYGGILTYSKKTEALRESAKRVALSRILSETDSPYLAPRPMKPPNRPPYVKKVVELLSQLRLESQNESKEEIVLAIQQNFSRLFSVENSSGDSSDDSTKES